jgi:signal recognition particle subunit SRP19
MSHARIEEVSDSDSDPSEGNISDLEDDFDERDILKARPSHVTPNLNQAQKSTAQHLIDPSAIPVQRASTFIAPDGTKFQTATDESKYKNFQCLYPVYFDKTRSRAEGRRVGRENAVENPLAREIVAACGRLRLETLFEPAKLHPKDWANPGRVKVKIVGANNPLVNNSQSTHHVMFFLAGLRYAYTPLHLSIHLLTLRDNPFF